jgi:hypothetical protein
VPSHMHGQLLLGKIFIDIDSRSTLGGNGIFISILATDFDIEEGSKLTKFNNVTIPEEIVTYDKPGFEMSIGWGKYDVTNVCLRIPGDMRNFN